MMIGHSIEIPKRLRTRPKDRRGYPVPVVVMVDAAKRPHFTVSDAAAVDRVGRKRLCGLCGKPLDAGAWFVGGPRCFLDPFGAFVDPAMHEDCARYAIRVCPYLAAPSYAKRIDDKTVDAAALVPGMAVGQHVGASPDDRPVLFGLAGCASYERVEVAPGQIIFRPAGPWTGQEWWVHGRQVDAAELGALLAKDAERWS